MLSRSSRILITGGTGSFGRAFVKALLQAYPDINRIVVFSRDELKQWQMQQEYPPDRYPNLRFFLGDVRDCDRLISAFTKIDIVIHAAALKQVPAAEYNPSEFIKTNVIGAENVVKASLATDVKRVIALSTDTAAAPVNLYGATKLCSDKLFVAANNISGDKDVRFSVIRYGNVLGSRGSVIPFFLQQAKTGTLSITHPEMTRFNITLQEGVQMVLWSISNVFGGEIFVPKIPSYRILDVAEAIGPSCERTIVGIRPGEKIHEEMITASDSYTSIDLGEYFAILPSDQTLLNRYSQSDLKFNMVSPGFSYSSGSNSTFLSVADIRLLIRQNIFSDFQPVWH